MEMKARFRRAAQDAKPIPGKSESGNVKWRGGGLGRLKFKHKRITPLFQDRQIRQRCGMRCATEDLARGRAAGSVPSQRGQAGRQYSQTRRC
jgi:hypothetical protein